jgi:hypothetical protein
VSRFLREQTGQSRPGPSVYEDRFAPADDDVPPEQWVTIAESGPGGSLRWARGWEQRVQGWEPFNEFLRNRGAA